MLFKPLDLTTALRPLLFPDESLIFVQDVVGLYEGKFKISNYQNGHAYLTSHRICYVAADEPRKHSVAIDLRDVDRVEYQASFLKSSPKIIVYPKPPKRSIGTTSTSTSASAPTQSSTRITRPAGALNATWVCSICSFSNPLPSNFDPTTATASTPLPSCLACGIKPTLNIVLKAAIAAAVNRDPSTLEAVTSRNATGPDIDVGSALDFPSRSVRADTAALTCHRCTFKNHPSLFECEICGASLLSRGSSVGVPSVIERSESPAPLSLQSSIQNTEIRDSIKFSFRDGGEKVFLERLKGALIQRKWLLQNAPPIPQPSQPPVQDQTVSPSPGFATQTPTRLAAVGIAGLEQRGLASRKNNELMIGNAFEDLEALMASAKQIVALAETLASESRMNSKGSSSETDAVLWQSATALGMTTTKDKLSSGAESLYLSELSRDLAEFLSDERRGVLRKEGGIMSLIDLWAIFNRTRNGVELVSPADFERAAELWEKLKLPVRLRRFKSGLLVVQRYNWNDEKTIKQFEEWMQELREQPPSEPVPWNWCEFGRGVTAQEAAQRFGWSVGVAAEELGMVEDRGILCREEGIEGVKFWGNYPFTTDKFAGEDHLSMTIAQLAV